MSWLAIDKSIETKTKYAIRSTLVTTYEVEENSYYGNIQSVITSEDLFRWLKNFKSSNDFSKGNELVGLLWGNNARKHIFQRDCRRNDESS